MKKFSLFALIITAVTVFSYCSSSKRATNKVPLLTYEANIQALVASKCAPCHIPAKGGNKMNLDNYDAVKSNIDSMIARIDLMPNQRGFMPFKKAKLSDSTINVFKQWRADGLLPR